MSVGRTVQAILDARLILVLRSIPFESLEGVAEALRRGGVRVVEVALNTENALEQMHRLRKYDFCLGAGTALDQATSRAAIDAGAAFLFSPIRSEFFLPLCRERGVVGIPGGLTPTEIYTLKAEGADFIKVFPGSLGGPGYLREILAPCRDLRLIPAGGVNSETLEPFLEAGAVAVAVGNEIADPQLAAEGKFNEIARRATRFTKTIQSMGKMHVRP